MQRLRQFICLFWGCDRHPGTCVCRRCGRVKHLGHDKPTLVDSHYELQETHRNGFLLYLKTEHRKYACMRCGESHDESICKYEFRSFAVKSHEGRLC